MICSYSQRMSSLPNRWEAFAQENAEFYIYTVPGVDFATPAGQAQFRESGREVVERILRESKPYLNRFDRAIEIGCGVGRLALPMAERFAEVIGIDIAPTMISKLGDYSRAAGVSNVRGFLAHEAWFDQGPADLVYSMLVFQHIESWPVIRDYFAGMAKCLAEDGICYAQFDTRRPTLPYLSMRVLPDAVLPKQARRSIRRVRRRPADLRSLFNSCGLTVLKELRADSEYHAFLLRRRRYETRILSQA
jgi:cyclopropane fatty-acyl-phospholipid synthase-like methyltransferase